MRDEIEMLNLIVNTAKEDNRVLAVYLKGSRANPNATKDVYQDFDIMYVVTEIASFRSCLNWMSAFGKIILMQEQDDDFGYGDRFGIRSHYDETYSWLLIFDDGNRIDIGVETISAMKSGRNRNKLFVPLLDKIGCLPQMTPASDEEFHIRKPTEKNFNGCCKEFYWCMCDVVKGIVRDEIPFAMTTYNTLVHTMLEQMLCWNIGISNDFTISIGKLNKYLKKYLEREIYLEYLNTYADYQHMDQAIAASGKLFKKVSLSVSKHFGYPYPYHDEEGAFKYIKMIRQIAAKK